MIESMRWAKESSAQQSNLVSLALRCLAGAATCLAWYTGNAMWDGIGSIAIGSLLGITAVILIQKNRQLLIGEAASALAALLHTVYESKCALS